MMITNDVGLTLLKSFEGLRLGAYRDSAGIFTIGWGHTGQDVYDGRQITEDEADALLRQDIGLVEETVTASVDTATTTENQFAAMVSLCFNIGRGNFRGSTVLRLHLLEDNKGAADAFLLWDKITINRRLTTSAGLARRRRSERTLYLTPV